MTTTIESSAHGDRAVIYLGGQSNSVEASPHLGDFLQGVLLSPGLCSVDGAVMKCVTGQVDHLGKKHVTCQNVEYTSSVEQLRVTFHCSLCEYNRV